MRVEEADWSARLSHPTLLEPVTRHQNSDIEKDDNERSEFRASKLRNGCTCLIKLEEFIKSSQLNFAHVIAKAQCEPV
jgi:hypothetical protein